MDIPKTLERLKKQALTDQERAEVYAVDILLSCNPEAAEAELIRFGLRHPELKTFVDHDRK